MDKLTLLLDAQDLIVAAKHADVSFLANMPAPIREQCAILMLMAFRHYKPDSEVGALNATKYFLCKQFEQEISVEDRAVIVTLYRALEDDPDNDWGYFAAFQLGWMPDNCRTGIRLRSVRKPESR